MNDQTAEPLTPDSPCDLVALFQDGLLGSEDAETFRRHLGACADCQGALQVGLLVESAARPPQGKVLKLVRRYAPQGGMALAASLLLSVGARYTLGPVALVDGPSRAQQEWVEAPSAQAFRPYQRSSRSKLGQGQVGDWAAYDQKQQRIGLLLRKRDRLLASAANALLHREDNRAEEYLHQLELLGGGGDALVARVLNNRGVLELQRAGDLGESCGAAAADLVTQAEQEAVCDEQMRLLRRALGFIEKSLEKDPDRASALFNRGLVLEKLGLGLSAAAAFEAAAKVAGPGWSEEAAREAARLRPQIEADKALTERVDRELKALTQAIEGAAEGDPQSVSRAKASVDDAIRFVKRLRDASRDVEPLRTQVHDLARPGTPLQRELLVPLAEALDGSQSALVRRLAARGPASSTHERFVALYKQQGGMKLEQRQALARDLEKAGEEELLLGLLTPNGHSELPVSDDVLKKLLRQEPYIAIRAGRFLGLRMMARGEEAGAAKVLQDMALQCDSRQNPERCAIIELALAWSAVTGERWSEAQAHYQRGFFLAHRVASSWARTAFLTGMADSASAQNDPWLALAYGGEARQTLDPCNPLYRRSLERMAAVRLYFFVDAQGALALLMQSAQPRGCPAGALTRSGLHVLASLVSMGVAAPDLQALLDGALGAPGPGNGKRSYVTEYWKAHTAMARNPPKGRAMLEELVSETEGPSSGDDGNLGERAKVRSYGYRELALEAGSAAAAGDRSGYARAFEMVARQLELKPPQACALAVVSNLGRTVAVARDDRGTFTGSFRDGGWRWVDRRGDLVVPAEVQGALRGCRQVKVLASPGVFGLSRLLSGIPWSYAVRQEHTPRGQAPARGLVVANADLPSGLKLEELSPLSTDDREPGTVVLQHRGATLSNVKRELEASTDVELYTHGNQKPNDAEGSYLVLTPDPAMGGEFRLTGRDVRNLKLEGAPLVFLKACVTADAGFQNHEARSLASAFVERGARATFASTVSIPDVDADRFFNAIRERTRQGLEPAEALFQARAAFKKDGHFQEWMDDVVCLEPA